MPRTPCDYSKTVIYRIFKEDTDIPPYIGSTTDFRRRKSQHKRCSITGHQKVYMIIRENGGWPAFKMLQIEEFPCKNGNEARAREQYWIDQYVERLNTRGAVLNKEHRQEKKKEYDVEYRATHTDEIAAYQKEYYVAHKDEIAARAATHTDEIAVRKKEYYAAHKDKFKALNKEYRATHKDKITAYKTERITCECGALLSRNYIGAHKKTAKHLAFQARV